MQETDKPRFVLYDESLYLEAIKSLELLSEELMEVKGFGFDDPGAALEASLKVSTAVLVIMAKEEVLGVVGYRVLPDGSASIWMMCDHRATKPVRNFYVKGKELVDFLCNAYGIVHGMVWSGHERSIRWLKHLGFYVNPSPVVMHDGLEFNYIYKTYCEE